MSQNPDHDPAASDREKYHSDAGVGGDVYREKVTTWRSGATQDAPAMAVHSTSTRAQIEGILEQSRYDVGARGAEELERVIRQRFKEARIQLDDAEIRQLAAG